MPKTSDKTKTSAKTSDKTKTSAKTSDKTSAKTSAKTKTPRSKTARKSKAKKPAKKSASTVKRSKPKSSKTSSSTKSTSGGSTVKREYRLLERKDGKTVITDHRAHNKGPGDAATKLAGPMFPDKKPGRKVKLTITKVSPGRNQGAIYEFEVEQYLQELRTEDKNIPKNLVIEKDGKRFRLRRKAIKLSTFTPTDIARAQTKRRKRTGDTGRLSKSMSKADDDNVDNVDNVDEIEDSE